MDFDSFLRAACPPLDLQWRKYRRRAARHRVTARMNELGLKDFASYLSYLQDHPEESTSLADRMLVTVTRFFRDRACWERLAKEVLEPAVAAGGKPFRAWSAGCCGGEEPYTLVLLWRSLVGSRPGSRRLQVVATDIDRASLERAAEGRYTSGSLREVPDGLREKHFRKEGSFLVLDEGVISAVTLRHSNLMTDPLPWREEDGGGTPSRGISPQGGHSFHRKEGGPGRAGEGTLRSCRTRGRNLPEEGRPVDPSGRKLF
jgi:chemotaxis methyl-accepting protein methylase